MSLARARALLGVVALAAATAAWIGPGASPAAAYVCSFSIDSPRPDQAFGAASVRFSGAFSVKPSQAGRTIRVSFLSSPGPRPGSVTRSGGDIGGTDRYDVGVGGLSFNGTYRAQVRATHAGTSLLNCGGGLGSDERSTEVTAEVTFGVSVRAKPPANVRSRLDGAPRTAVVTWEKSPDPDTAGYSLSRKIGSGVFQGIGDVPADALSWTDTALPADAASVTYAVTSSRNGPSPGTTSEPSAAVSASPLDLTAPPPPTIPGATPTGNAPAGNAPAGNAPAGNTQTPQGKPSSGRAGMVAGSTPFRLGRPVGGTISPFDPGGQVPDPLAGPDGTALLGQGASGGYQPTLPYKADTEQEKVELIEDGGGQAFVAGRRSVGGEQTPQLVYVAAGLLVAVVAAHLLWLRAQVLRPDAANAEAALPVEHVAPAMPIAPGSAGSLRPVLLIRQR